MQCLAAPTREELDRAHGRHSWLDIGVNSVRNLWRINTVRALLWLVLAVSSLPFHLLYNSVIFKVLATNEYGAVVVNPQFLNGTTNDWDFVSPTDRQTLQAVAFQNCSLEKPSADVKKPFSFYDMYDTCQLSDCYTGIGSSAYVSHPTLSDIITSCNRDTCPMTVVNSTLDDADLHTGSGLPVWITLGDCPFYNCTIQRANKTLSTVAQAVHQCFNPGQMTADWHNKAVFMRDRYLKQPSTWQKLPLFMTEQNK